MNGGTGAAGKEHGARSVGQIRMTTGAVGWVERVYNRECRFFAVYFKSQETERDSEQSETHLGWKRISEVGMRSGECMKTNDQ